MQCALYLSYLTVPYPRDPQIAPLQPLQQPQRAVRELPGAAMHAAGRHRIARAPCMLLVGALLYVVCLMQGASPGAAILDEAVKKSGVTLPGGIKVSVKEVPEDELPPPANPYAGKPYAGCDGGYCESEDAKLEARFWRTAERGKAKKLRILLGEDRLNLTRNIVPDSEGFARVVDVAVWVASFKGHVEVMKVRAPLAWRLPARTRGRRAGEEACGEP